MQPDEPVELLPGEGLALTPSIEPLEQDTDRHPDELLHRGAVKGHPVILEVSSQLGAENLPDDRQPIPIPDLPGPRRAGVPPGQEKA